MSKQPSQPSGPSAPDAELESELSLEDTDAHMARAGRAPRGLEGHPPAGYNPYDVSPDQLAATARMAQLKPRSRPKDLRKLSEWIRTRRQVEALKKDDPDPDPEPGSK